MRIIEEWFHSGLRSLISISEVSAASMGTALLLHGFGASADQWRPVLSILPPRIQGIAIDLPGHGSSQQEISHPVARMAGDLKSLFQQLAAPMPRVLVGHSLAGPLAVELASMAELAPIGGLMAICSACPLNPNPRLLAKVSAGENLATAVIAGLQPLADPALIAQVVGDFDELRMPDIRVKVWGGVKQQRLASGGLAANQRAIVVVAEGDRVVSPRRGRAFASHLRATLVSLPKAGHYPHLTSPMEIASLIAGLF